MKKHEEKPTQQASDGSFLGGALFGALVGAALGILYAPSKGSDTRKKLKKEIDRVKDKAEPIVKEAVRKSKPALQKLRTEAEPLLEDAKQKINEVLEDIDDEIVRRTKKKKGFFR